MQDWTGNPVFRSWFHWERGAVVTDVNWMRWATTLFSVLLPGQWRVCPGAGAVGARQWIAEPSPLS